MSKTTNAVQGTEVAKSEVTEAQLKQAGNAAVAEYKDSIFLSDTSVGSAKLSARDLTKAVGKKSLESPETLLKKIRVLRAGLTKLEAAVATGQYRLKGFKGNASRPEEVMEYIRTMVDGELF